MTDKDIQEIFDERRQDILAEPGQPTHRAEYQGVFGPVVREFYNYDRAIQWLAQVGKYAEGVITKI